MQWLVIPYMRYLLLPLLKWTTQSGRDRAWVGWEWITRIFARITGRCAGILLPKDLTGLAGIIKLTDLADGMIGAVGEWQLEGDSCAIKTITHCPLSEQLTLTPGVCTNLGFIMGQEAFKAYAPNLQVDYKIPTTMSQGHIACQYIIQLKEEK